MVIGVGKGYNIRRLMRVKISKLFKAGLNEEADEEVSEFGWTPKELVSHLCLNGVTREEIINKRTIYHIDHIIPLYVFEDPFCFYANSLDNLQLLHKDDHALKAKLESSLINHVRNLRKKNTVQKYT